MCDVTNILPYKVDVLVELTNNLKESGSVSALLGGQCICTFGQRSDRVLIPPFMIT